jgi:ribonucleoside-diphosphate reductase alpha chain
MPDKFERPARLIGYTEKIKTGFGNLYITVNEKDGKPVELFATVGKSGKSIMAKTEAIGRLVTLCLQNGVEMITIIDQLKDIEGENPVADGDGVVKSIPDAIAKVLAKNYVVNQLTMKGD